MFQVAMMAVDNPVHRLTEAEYLDLERRAEFRSEFLDGEMFAMAGGTSSHSLIKCNLIRALGNQLEQSPCVVYGSDMRVKVQMAGLYTYPDFSVACGRNQFEDENKDTLLDPMVIGEVLSESREAYDRGKKFEMYRRIPSLREYLLVNQFEPLIEPYVRRMEVNGCCARSRACKAGWRRPHWASRLIWLPFTPKSSLRRIPAVPKRGAAAFKI